MVPQIIERLEFGQTQSCVVESVGVARLVILLDFGTDSKKQGMLDFDHDKVVHVLPRGFPKVTSLHLDCIPFTSSYCEFIEVELLNIKIGLNVIGIGYCSLTSPDLVWSVFWYLGKEYRRVGLVVWSRISIGGHMAIHFIKYGTFTAKGMQTRY